MSTTVALTHGGDRPHLNPPPGTLYSQYDLTPTDEEPYGVCVFYDEMPVLPDAPLPSPESWGQFKTSFVGDAGYLRITLYAHPAILAALSGEVSRDRPHLPSLKTMWDAIIANLPEGQTPTPTEIAAWGVIATAANIPVSFDAAGLLVIEE